MNCICETINRIDGAYRLPVVQAHWPRESLRHISRQSIQRTCEGWTCSGSADTGKFLTVYLLAKGVFTSTFSMQEHSNQTADMSNSNSGARKLLSEMLRVPNCIFLVNRDVQQSHDPQKYNRKRRRHEIKMQCPEIHRSTLSKKLYFFPGCHLWSQCYRRTASIFRRGWYLFCFQILKDNYLTVKCLSCGRVKWIKFIIYVSYDCFFFADQHV